MPSGRMDSPMRTAVRHQTCRARPAGGGCWPKMRLPLTLASAVIDMIALSVALPRADAQQPLVVTQVNVVIQPGNELPAPEPLPSPGPPTGLSLADLEQMALQNNPS